MSATNPPQSARRDQAAYWLTKMSQRSVSTADVAAFRAWSDDPDNWAAYEELDPLLPRPKRFGVREDREGFSVVDIWTGEPAVIALTPQTGMSAVDAAELAGLLNRRAAAGDRAIRS